MKKNIIKLFAIAACVIGISHKAHAAQACNITSEKDDITYQTLRYAVESVMWGNAEGGCSIDDSDSTYKDKGTGVENLIQFLTEETGSSHQIKNITLSYTVEGELKPLRFKALQNVIVGNYSPEAIADTSDITYDATNYQKDDGTITDYGYVIIDAGAFPEGTMPLTCYEGNVGTIYLRSLVIVGNVSQEEFFATTNTETTCFKDGGALHFCKGTLIDGVDPNSGADFCTETEPTEEDCPSGEYIKVYQDDDSDGYGSRSENRSASTSSSSKGKFSTPGDNIGIDVSITGSGSGAGIGGGITVDNSRVQEICADDDVPAGYSAVKGDCNDTNSAVNPGATEVCDDSIDNNCDGQVDEDCTSTTDADGDGYTTDSDCDDADATINPGATETCGDSIDQDCSGEDLACESTESSCTDGVDNDADTFVDCADTEDCGADATCDSLDDDDGDGFTDAEGDCDDTDAAISPSATEVCDCDDSTDATCVGVDNDCDGTTDEDLTCTTPVETVDADADGYDSTLDCNDDDATINPDATEICFDDTDQDCDGSNSNGCSPEICDDQTDNDLDGVSDCEDNDCDSANACNGAGLEEECTDEIDNEGDGYTDCEDNDCMFEDSCISDLSESDACDDGIDNDLDDLTDCDDTDCSSFDMGDGLTCADFQITPVGEGYEQTGGGGCSCDMSANPGSTSSAQMMAGFFGLMLAIGLRAKAKGKEI